MSGGAKSHSMTDVTVAFGAAFSHSETFGALFREGMHLVEETSRYLDDDGRRESRELSRIAATAYATESMRLTTRLMQLASWLLLHRSIAEGDMTSEQAEKEKQKIRIGMNSIDRSGPAWEGLPATFRALVERSLSLQSRIERIEASLTIEQIAPVPNQVNRQLAQLNDAFSD